MLDGIVIVLASIVSEYVNLTLGLGYGMLMAPILLLAGYSPLQVIPALLATQLVAGIIGAFTHHKAKNVDFNDTHTRKSTVLLVGANLLGVFLAVNLALSIPEEWITAYIGLLALTVGITLISVRKSVFGFSWKKLGVVGTLAGFNKGFTGGGYGPVMMGGQMLVGGKARTSVGITLLAEGLTSLVGFGLLLGYGSIHDWNLIFPAILGAVIAVPPAVYSAKRFKDDGLGVLIGSIVIGLGILTLSKIVL